MSKNLVRECVYLKLDVNQPKPYRVGDRVKLLGGPYAGQIGKVIGLGSWTDPRIRVRVWPASFATLTCVEEKNLEPWRGAVSCGEVPRGDRK